MTTTELDRVHDDLAQVALALARRFARGATMWCVSPATPHHARHVAVEFVHPVMVGKRALPAVALPAIDAVAGLRASVRAGDIVVLIAAADDPSAREVARRAPAWGVLTVWLGDGPRPTPGAADHLLWLEEPGASHDGRFILLYHLLWELTHVCFEHVGTRTLDAEVDPGAACVTCADEGRLAEIVAVDGDTATARVEGHLETVDTTLVAPVAPHDLVLAHAGTALSKLDDAARQDAPGPRSER